MNVLYFDCFSGISGDMVLGALLDLGASRTLLEQELLKLGLDRYRLDISKKQKNGISGTDVHVVLEGEHAHHHDHVHSHEHSHDHAHRTLRDILERIGKSSLSDDVKALSGRIFTRLARAEAKVHDKDLYEVHFHEVGAVDSIVDIVGAAILLCSLSYDVVYCSPVREGSGFVNCQHGLIPVPVPATVGVLQESNISLVLTDTQGEMVTPTGAAILAEICTGILKNPALRIEQVGYGMGKKDFEHPNVLRITQGMLETQEAEDTAVLLETNLDDVTAEILGYTMERLLETGAKDVWFTPIYMKKMRPAYQLSTLCGPADSETVKSVIFEETGTLGIREQRLTRTCLPRRIDILQTKYGAVRIKESAYGAKPEFEDAKKIAVQNNLPLRRVIADIAKDLEK